MQADLSEALAEVDGQCEDEFVDEFEEQSVETVEAQSPSTSPNRLQELLESEDPRASVFAARNANLPPGVAAQHERAAFDSQRMRMWEGVFAETPEQTFANIFRKCQSEKSRRLVHFYAGLGPYRSMRDWMDDEEGGTSESNGPSFFHEDAGELLIRANECLSDRNLSTMLAKHDPAIFQWLTRMNELGLFNAYAYWRLEAQIDTFDDFGIHFSDPDSCEGQRLIAPLEWDPTYNGAMASHIGDGQLYAGSVTNHLGPGEEMLQFRGYQFTSKSDPGDFTTIPLFNRAAELQMILTVSPTIAYAFDGDYIQHTDFQGAVPPIVWQYRMNLPIPIGVIRCDGILLIGDKSGDHLTPESSPTLERDTDFSDSTLRLDGVPADEYLLVAYVNLGREALDLTHGPTIDGVGMLRGEYRRDHEVFFSMFPELAEFGKSLCSSIEETSAPN